MPDTLITMSESMKQAFGLIRRPWGVFYLKNKITGQQTSLKTSDKARGATHPPGAQRIGVPAAFQPVAGAGVSQRR